MKLQVAPYNNTAGTWTETEETAFLHYAPTHRFDNPAEVTIILSDPTGAIARKYNADADDVYVGPGKVTIEDPDGSDIFYGRIMKAIANTDNRTLELYCQDWLSQLDEEQVTYDMREKLSGNIRQYVAGTDPDHAVEAYRAPSYNNLVPDYFFSAEGMAWANDVYNGMYLIFTNGMAGKETWGTGAYYGEPDFHGGAGIETNAVDEAWVDDANYYRTRMNEAFGFEVEFRYRVYLGHNTPSNFYVHDSISAARIHCTVEFPGVVEHTTDVTIWDGAAFQLIGEIPWVSLSRKSFTFEIPGEWVSDIVDADGLVKVEFQMSAGADISFHYLRVEVDVETTGYSSAITINDGGANWLEVATDLTAAATRIWEGCPFCITQPIYLHIESATGPVLGGDTMVTLTCGVANVENTSGISTRQYVNKTRLEILKDLAVQDKAHFWITLGGVVVTYKSTFNDGAPETLTDTDLNSIKSTYDYSTLVNEVTAYGMRIGDSRLSSTYTDATSEGKYKQTRTKVTSDTGLVSEYDTLARATALVNQYKDVQQILSVTIRGNTAKAAHAKTLKLGDEVSITSTYLGLSAAVYIVQRWSYDSRNNLTTLLLHPRVSAIGLQRDERPSFEQSMQAYRRGTADRYIAAPETNEVP